MEPRQPTDHAQHAEHFGLLVSHPEEVARQLGGAALGYEAIGAIIKADCLCWPLSVCPPAAAARLFATMGRALEQDASWLRRQVRQ